MPRPSSSNRTSLRWNVALLLVVALASLVWLSFRSNSPTTAPMESASAHVTVARASAAQWPSTTPAPLTPLAGESWHEPAARTGVDASNIYKNAFVLFDRLTDEEKKMVRQPRDEVDAEKAAALFEKLRAIMDLLREAAKADYCDWGLAPYTFDTPMPHISKAVDLGKLALWAAGYQIGSDPAASIDALAIRAQLGHNLADTLIGLLVETNFEKGALDLLHQNLGALDAATTMKASDLVRASTVDSDVTRAFEAEVAGADMMGKQLAVESAEERGKMLASLVGRSDQPAEERAETAQRFEAIFRDPAKVLEETAYMREIEQRLGNAMLLPEAEFQRVWSAIENELSTSNHLLARIAVPSFTAVQVKMQQTRVERTLLDAGLDVLQNGPAQLARYRDPATGNALLYIPTHRGFDLRSTYAVKGKPVTLSFPTSK